MIISGIDTLEFELDIVDYLGSAKELLTSLTDLKEERIRTGKEKHIELNGVKLDIAPSGAKFYRFKLVSNDFHILLMLTPMQHNYPIRVKFFSSYLWSYGYKEAYKRFIEWFTSVLPVLANRISRVDIACDTDEFAFYESDLQNFISRASNKTINSPTCEISNRSGKSFTGFTFGKGDPLLCRIYNKSKEIKKSKKTWFNTIYMQNGSDLHNDIWRTEFQIRRKMLKQSGVHTMDDFIRKKSNIWAYLTEKWLVLRNNDDINQSRRSVNINWCEIQRSAKDYYACPIIRKEIRQQNVQGLLDQIAGCTLSLSAINNYQDEDEAFNVAKKYLENKLKPTFPVFITRVAVRPKLCRFLPAFW